MQILGADEKRLHIFQQIHIGAEDGEIAATAEQMLLAVDTNQGRVIAAPEAIAKKCRNLGEIACRLADSVGDGARHCHAKKILTSPKILLLFARYGGGRAMNFGLTEEQLQIAESVRKFAERELHPLESAAEKSGKVAREIGEDIKRKVKALGFYAPNMPADIGGGGLNHLEFTILERELGRASMALSVFWGRPSNILLACKGEQRERFLMPAVSGEKMDALAMTEPAAGSDLRGMKCAAVRKNGDWILNGSKHFISHADIADFFIVFAATGEEKFIARNSQINHLLFN